MSDEPSGVLPTPEQIEEGRGAGIDVTITEVPTAEGTLRVELEHDMAADKIKRHAFYLNGKKITKKKALALKKPK